MDGAEALGVLHSLYSMTLGMHAREAVAHVLSLADNMSVFLPFVELSGQSATPPPPLPDPPRPVSPLLGGGSGAECFHGNDQLRNIFTKSIVGQLL